MAIRAFQKEYNYYRLKQDCLGLKAGAIFYHDKSDQELGSISQGCLKLAWDADGNCFEYCADTYILHASAIEDTAYLERVDTDTKSDVIKIILDRLNEWLNESKSYETDFSSGSRSAYNRMLNYLENLK